MNDRVDESGDMHTFALAELFSLPGVDAPNLLFRENGEKAFSCLERRLCSMPEVCTLTLVGDGVALMDASFADASVVELAFRLQRGDYGDRFLVIENIHEGTRTNLVSALARRHSHKQDVVLLVREGHELLPIGDIEPNLLSTWTLVRESGPVTARGLADQLNLEISAAGMRLKKLYDARLLVRRDGTTLGSRQLAYTVPR